MKHTIAQLVPHIKATNATIVVDSKMQPGRELLIPRSLFLFLMLLLHFNAIEILIHPSPGLVRSLHESL